MDKTVTVTQDAVRLGTMAFRMDSAAIERDVRLSELTDDEVGSIVHAVLASAALASQTAQMAAPDGLVEFLAQAFWDRDRRRLDQPKSKLPKHRSDYRDAARAAIAYSPKGTAILASLSASNDSNAMREALEKARDVFAHYAKLHKAKGTPDGEIKAAINYAYSLEMDEALANTPKLDPRA